MIMITLNCDWTTPEEETSGTQIQRGLKGISAIIGVRWRPLCSANENRPQWLEVYG